LSSGSISEVTKNRIEKKRKEIYTYIYKQIFSLEKLKKMKKTKNKKQKKLKQTCTTKKQKKNKIK
jgi:hypothetical protein